MNPSNTLLPSIRLTSILLVSISSACWLTRQWHSLFQLDLVIAALINTLLYSLIPLAVLKHLSMSRVLLLDCAYIGAFIALDVSLYGYDTLLWACALASWVYWLSNRYWVGLGGRLGTQAFITCTLLIGIDTCWQMLG